MSGWCITSNEQCVNMLCTRPARFVDFYSTDSLKQQFKGSLVAPLGHIISILNQLAFALAP